MRDLLRAYFSRRTLVSLYNLFFSLSRKLLTSFPLSLVFPKSNNGDGDGAVAESEAVPLLDLSKPSSPISFPIKSLQDLKSRSYFDSFHFQFNRSTVPLRRNSDESPNRPRLLVCHDMKGGYVDDKWIQGCGNESGFAIWHWYLMDIFVYFSHSLVTLPPPCWTNTAHRHGVKVLGTFITEWDDGKATCKEMFGTKESAQVYAERLGELATSLGFDGWLINIENEVDEEQIPNLKEFVSHLTKVSHTSIPGALLYGEYDSVTVRGDLEWQDQLTEKNKPFFDLCDGIFINYTWKESYPKLSAEVAGDRKFDVYMGIDVFGRGSFGGGQWTVNAALDLLKKNNVSAAIFAPGWVYETAQPPNFHTAQNKWWSLVEKSWGIVQTYPQVLPFYSDFNQGFGYHVSLEGRQLSGAPWYNISCQSLQPLLEFNEDNTDIIQVTVDAREASYNGGGNIAFKGTLEGDAHFTTRLFKPHLQLSSSPITISYSVKSDESSKLGIMLSFSSPSHETNSILVLPQEPIHRSSEPFLQCLVASERTVSEWMVHETSLVMDGHTLTEISAFCYRPENSTKKPDYVALLGHISIKDQVQLQQKPNSLPPASSWAIKAHNVELVPGNSGSKILRVKLEWKQKHPEETVFPRYNVYAETVKSTDLRSRKVLEKPRSETVFLGSTLAPAYYISELVVESDVKGVSFLVQASAEDGSWEKLDDSPNLLVDLEGLSSKDLS